MAVAANADDYANDRLNIFFSGVIPSLDGQCVSLVKWFMQEMSAVPNPQAARGDARYVGKTLEAQGHAVEVPWADRQRGDIVCYEYGTYGHIGVLLSGNRTFEENVNWPGVSSKIVDGSRVYASRIGSMSESWRHDMHIYRLNTYTEGGSVEPSNEGDVINLYGRLLRRKPEPGAIEPWLDKPFKQAFYGIGDSAEGKKVDFDLTLNEGDLTNYYRNVLGHDPNSDDIEFHINQHHGIWKYMVEDSINRPDFLPKVQANQIVELNKIIVDLKDQLAHAGGTIDPKTQAQLDRIDQNTAATRGLVQTIFDYFAGQYATFKKYIKK